MTDPVLSTVGAFIGASSALAVPASLSDRPAGRRGTLADMPSFDAPDDHDDHDDAPAPAPVTVQEYERLADLRAGLREYLGWAEEEARRHDTTPMQFQLALAIRSSPATEGPTVTELATALQLKHHSVVGLIDRTEAAGLVRRDRDIDNGARVRVSLTPAGELRLEALAARHQHHLTSIAQSMSDLWAAFAPPEPRENNATQEG